MVCSLKPSKLWASKVELYPLTETCVWVVCCSKPKCKFVYAYAIIKVLCRTKIGKWPFNYVWNFSNIPNQLLYDKASVTCTSKILYSWSLHHLNFQNLMFTISLSSPLPISLEIFALIRWWVLDNELVVSHFRLKNGVIQRKGKVQERCWERGSE